MSDRRERQATSLGVFDKKTAAAHFVRGGGRWGVPNNQSKNTFGGRAWNEISQKDFHSIACRCYPEFGITTKKRKK